MGLLKPVHRSKGGFRLYAPSAIKRVEWIGKLQDAGFSLHELQQLLNGVSEQGTVASMAMEHVRQVFEERLRDTRAQLRKLTQLEQDLVASLAYLEGCRSCEPQKHHIQECPTCDHNGHHGGQQPILVAGIHRG
jgi:DNA-binding transcriptional MerR regulator